jgi:WD40 repeat protein
MPSPFLRILFIPIFMSNLPSCQRRSESGLSDESTNQSEAIPTVDGKIALDGFIVGGSFGSCTEEAIRHWGGACDRLMGRVYQTFQHYQIQYDRDHFCGQPVNKSPFGEGFLYVSNPSYQFVVNPEDKIIRRIGPSIVGQEAKSYELYYAFESFLDECFTQIAKIKAKNDPSFITADCGKPELKVIQLSSPDPNTTGKVHFKISSQMRMYSRENASGSTQATQKTTPKLLSAMRYNDTIAALAIDGSSTNKAIYAAGFAGSVGKLDLKSKKIVWQKNLTNPQPTSVRESTGIDTLALSSNGAVLAAGGSYGYLTMLDATTGKKLRYLSCREPNFLDHHYLGLTFNASSRVLFSMANRDTYPNHYVSYNSKRFPSDDSTTLTAHTLKAWDSQTGKIIWSKDFKISDFIAMKVVQNENFLIVSTTASVMLVNAKNGEKVQSFDLVRYEGNIPGSFISAAAFNKDLRILAIAAFSGVMLIDTQSLKLISRLTADMPFELGNLTFSKDDSRLTGIDAWGSVYEWSVRNLSLEKQGRDESLAIGSNGPRLMPIVKLPDQSIYLSISTGLDGSGVLIPAAPDPSELSKNVCEPDLKKDLPPLQLRDAQMLHFISFE